VTGTASTRIDKAEEEVGVSEDLPFLGTTVPVHTREVTFTRAYLTRKRKRKAGSGSTVFTFGSKQREFVQRSDGYTAFDWTSLP